MVTWIAFPQKECQKYAFSHLLPQLFRLTKTFNVDKIGIHCIAV